MRLDLYCKQTGPSQAAGGSANGLTAYLEGLSFRGIERILQVSHVTVIQWVRRWGKAIEGMRKEAEPKEVRQVGILESLSVYCASLFA
jgi:transposase-like protein